MCFNLQKIRTGNGLSNIKGTFAESFQLQMSSVLHKVSAASRLVFQFSVMAVQNIKKQQMMCQIPMKMLKPTYETQVDLVFKCIVIRYTIGSNKKDIKLYLLDPFHLQRGNKFSCIRCLMVCRNIQVKYQRGCESTLVDLDIVF